MGQFIRISVIAKPHWGTAPLSQLMVRVLPASRALWASAVHILHELVVEIEHTRLALADRIDSA
jgi:hypothetical protein